MSSSLCSSPTRLAGGPQVDSHTDKTMKDSSTSTSVRNKLQRIMLRKTIIHGVWNNAGV